MEKRAAREFDHPDPAIRLHDRQERDGFGADNRRDGHPAQRVGQRILHRVERQRLHPPGEPHPRIGTGSTRFRGEEDPQAVHQIVRQIHLCRDTRAARTRTRTRPGSGNGTGTNSGSCAGSQSCDAEKNREKTSGRNAPETDMPEAAVAEHVAAEAAPAEPAAAEKKAAPAPDTAQPQPIIRPIDEDFKTLLANTIEDAADDSGWAFLGIVGGVLTKKMPDFDPRNYGYKKLSLLVKSLSKIVEIEERPSENGELKLVYVRNRTR